MMSQKLFRVCPKCGKVCVIEYLPSSELVSAACYTCDYLAVGKKLGEFEMLDEKMYKWHLERKLKVLDQ